ncbi:metallophosphoesterase, partial [bacterium]|nr:metallophosphoesterase [bacterium]
MTSCAAPPDPETVFEFAIMGDMPYSDASLPLVESLIQDINADAGLEWVVHVGDTKAGGDSCADSILTGRFDLFNTFQKPFFFTPGDNDWYDCSQENAGGWEPSERLDFLRKLYYADPHSSSAGSPMAVYSQADSPEYAEFVENQMWEKGGVVFATVHLVAITRASPDSVDATRREEAAAQWIAKAFERAKESKSKGVFIATQVDPWPVSGNPAIVGSLCPACFNVDRGVNQLSEVLQSETQTFDGQVVLAVGDTHVFRVDKPLY